MKKLLIITLSILLLTGCQKNQDEKNENEISVVKLENYYEVLSPYKPQKYGQYWYYSTPKERKDRINRYENDEINTELMAITSKYYSSNKYLIQEDQYLSYEDQMNIIEKVNPKVIQKVNNKYIIPKYIVGLKVQNYYRSRNDIKMKGIAVGVILDKEQVYKNENDKIITTTVDDLDILNYSKTQLSTIIESLRLIEAYQNTEIVIGLYILNNKDDLNPGSYHLYGKVEAGANRIASLNELNKVTRVIPSSDVNNIDKDFNALFTSFIENVKSNYPHNLGIIGRVKYDDDQIRKLSIHVTSNSNQKLYLISLTQYIYNQLKKNFDYNYDLEVVIKTYDKIEATLVKKGNSDIIVHIFD